MILFILSTALLAWFCIRPLVHYLHDPKHLRKYPNQNLLSGWTTLAYLWERRNPFRTRKLFHQHQHHPILRLGPTILSFADVGAIKDIYGHGSPCLKDDVYQLITGDHAHILNVVDKDEHSRKRRMLSNAFATRNLEQWEFKIADKVAKLVAQFDQRCTGPLPDVGSVDSEDLTVDFRWWSNLFTVEAIADIALSERLGMLESGTDWVKGTDKSTEHFQFLHSLHYGNRAVSRFVGATDWFHFLKRLTSLLSPHFRAHGDDFGRIFRLLTDRRMERYKSGEKLDDFLNCLIEDRMGKSRNLHRREIEAETSVLLDAGSDTTAIALANLLYYLIKNPDSLAKLRRELSGVLSSDTIAPYAKVKNLPYLKACIEESLRLSPPVPRGLERKTPPQGMQILGETISGGVTVSVPAYVAHRDATIFRDPESYLPERWLDGADKIPAMRAAFIPFTTGARACIGRNITMMEQQILIATLVHRYEFVLPSADWRMHWEEAFNLWPAQMPLKIWLREKTNAGCHFDELMI